MTTTTTKVLAVKPGMITLSVSVAWLTTMMIASLLDGVDDGTALGKGQELHPSLFNDDSSPQDKKKKGGKKKKKGSSKGKLLLGCFVGGKKNKQRRRLEEEEQQAKKQQQPALQALLDMIAPSSNGSRRRGSLLGCVWYMSLVVVVASLLLGLLPKKKAKEASNPAVATRQRSVVPVDNEDLVMKMAPSEEEDDMQDALEVIVASPTVNEDGRVLIMSKATAEDQDPELVLTDCSCADDEEEEGVDDASLTAAEEECSDGGEKNNGIEVAVDYFASFEFDHHMKSLSSCDDDNLPTSPVSMTADDPERMAEKDLSSPPLAPIIVMTDQTINGDGVQSVEDTSSVASATPAPLKSLPPPEDEELPDSSLVETDSTAVAQEHVRAPVDESSTELVIEVTKDDPPGRLNRVTVNLEQTDDFVDECQSLPENGSGREDRLAIDVADQDSSDLDSAVDQNAQEPAPLVLPSEEANDSGPADDDHHITLDRHHGDEGEEKTLSSFGSSTGAAAQEETLPLTGGVPFGSASQSAYEKGRPEDCTSVDSSQPPRIVIDAANDLGQGTGTDAAVCQSPEQPKDDNSVESGVEIDCISVIKRSDHQWDSSSRKDTSTCSSQPSRIAPVVPTQQELVEAHAVMESFLDGKSADTEVLSLESVVRATRPVGGASWGTASVGRLVRKTDDAGKEKRDRGTDDELLARVCTRGSGMTPVRRQARPGFISSSLSPPSSDKGWTTQPQHHLQPTTTSSSTKEHQKAHGEAGEEARASLPSKENSRSNIFLSMFKSPPSAPAPGCNNGTATLLSAETEASLLSAAPSDERKDGHDDKSNSKLGSLLQSVSGFSAAPSDEMGRAALTRSREVDDNPKRPFETATEINEIGDNHGDSRDRPAVSLAAARLFGLSTVPDPTEEVVMSPQESAFARYEMQATGGMKQDEPPPPVVPSETETSSSTSAYSWWRSFVTKQDLSNIKNLDAVEGTRSDADGGPPTHLVVESDNDNETIVSNITAATGVSSSSMPMASCTIAQNIASRQQAASVAAESGWVSSQVQKRDKVSSHSPENPARRVEGAAQNKEQLNSAVDETMIPVEPAAAEDAIETKLSLSVVERQVKERGAVTTSYTTAVQKSKNKAEEKKRKRRQRREAELSRLMANHLNRSPSICDSASEEQQSTPGHSQAPSTVDGSTRKDVREQEEARRVLTSVAHLLRKTRSGNDQTKQADTTGAMPLTRRSGSVGASASSDEGPSPQAEAVSIAVSSPVAMTDEEEGVELAKPEAVVETGSAKELLLSGQVAKTASVPDAKSSSADGYDDQTQNDSRDENPASPLSPSEQPAPMVEPDNPCSREETDESYGKPTGDRIEHEQGIERTLTSATTEDSIIDPVTSTSDSVAAVSSDEDESDSDAEKSMEGMTIDELLFASDDDDDDHSSSEDEKSSLVPSVAERGIVHDAGVASGEDESAAGCPKNDAEPASSSSLDRSKKNGSNNSLKELQNVTAMTRILIPASLQGQTGDNAVEVVAEPDSKALWSSWTGTSSRWTFLDGGASRSSSFFASMESETEATYGDGATTDYSVTSASTSMTPKRLKRTIRSLQSPSSASYCSRSYVSSATATSVSETTSFYSGSSYTGSYDSGTVTSDQTYGSTTTGYASTTTGGGSSVSRGLSDAEKARLFAASVLVESDRLEAKRRKKEAASKRAAGMFSWF